MIGEALKKMRFLGLNAQMAKLHLGLCPGKRCRALESGRVMVFVGKIEHVVSRRRDNRPDRRSVP